MTEVLLSHMDPIDSPIKVGYTGHILPNTQAKVVDVITGERLPPFQDGEICMKSVCVR